MQRKFKMGQVVSILVDAEFVIPDHVFMDNSLAPMLRLGSEHVDLFIPNELLVGKKLHPLIALLLFLKLKALKFFHLQRVAQLFLGLDSFFLPLYKTQERVFFQPWKNDTG